MLKKDQAALEFLVIDVQDFCLSDEIGQDAHKLSQKPIMAASLRCFEQGFGLPRDCVGRIRSSEFLVVSQLVDEGFNEGNRFR